MIPDFLPMLRKGKGRHPEEGGCIMQVVGFLVDGSSWTDRPQCVHPLLQNAAIAINDRMPDHTRHQLGALADRFVNTGNYGLSGDDLVALRTWAFDTIEPFAEEDTILLYRHAQLTLRGPAGSWAAQRFAEQIVYALPSPSSPGTHHFLNVVRGVMSAHGRPGRPASEDTVINCASMHAIWGDGAGWLAGLLDEFDRLVGRTAEQAFAPTPERKQQVLDLIGAATVTG